MASFKCKDLGMECAFEAKAWTRGSLMKKVAAHAKSVHQIDPIPADLRSKIEAAIQ